MSIVVRTLSEQIFAIVRDQIVFGALPLDQPIRQDALANQLGVSKIPLREALARLEQEGLLVGQPNRGYFVRAMSAQEAAEIFALRLAIEPGAVAAAAEAATNADCTAVRDAFAALELAIREHADEVGTRTRALHRALVGPGGRLLTAQLVERLQILSERYLHRHLAPTGSKEAIGSHAALVEAWIKGDGARVRTLVHEDIEGAGAALQRALSG